MLFTSGLIFRLILIVNTVCNPKNLLVGITPKKKRVINSLDHPSYLSLWPYFFIQFLYLSVIQYSRSLFSRLRMVSYEG